MVRAADNTKMTEQTPGQTGGEIMRDPRRSRNIRLGLFMASIALFFYFFIMFKYKVLMS